MTDITFLILERRVKIDAWSGFCFPEECPYVLAPTLTPNADTDWPSGLCSHEREGSVFADERGRRAECVCAGLAGFAGLRCSCESFWGGGGIVFVLLSAGFCVSLPACFYLFQRFICRDQGAYAWNWSESQVSILLSEVGIHTSASSSCAVGRVFVLEFPRAPANLSARVQSFLYASLCLPSVESKSVLFCLRQSFF